MPSNREIKNDIIQKLYQRPVFIRQVSDIQYVTRCPYCGDSHSNSNTGHFYMKINPSDNSMIVYNCFKCPAQGTLKYEDLELLLGPDDDMKRNIDVLNKTSDGYIESKAITKYFDYKLPTNYDKSKLEYIEKRLGIPLNNTMLKDLRIITSLKDFLMLNGIERITCKPGFAKLLDSKYVGFLSNGNSHILFRDVTDTLDMSWFKYVITPESSGNRVFHSMASEVDVLSTEKLYINLSEGIMDEASIAYNLGYAGMNSLNIAICGKGYANFIKNLISMGFIGSNIIVNIFCDNDAMFNTGKKSNYNTSIEYLRHALKKYSYIFGEVNVYYNIKYKDCGVPRDQIELIKYKI